MTARGEAMPGSAFWREAFTLHGAATVRVLPRTVAFAAFAELVALLHRGAPWLAIGNETLAGAGLVLGVLLVFRTAAGYERWWEARVLWGGIVNQSRNLVVEAVAYGPSGGGFRDELARWVIAYAYATRGTLRGQRGEPELERLVGDLEAARIREVPHMPTYVSSRIAGLLRQAREGGLDGFAFLQLERERSRLIDHVGGCERILNTPIPRVYSVTVRRFLLIYLCALPFALAPTGLLSPAYMLLIAYPVLSLEQIGAELQNPFVVRSLSHLDLDTYCLNIERELLAVVAAAAAR